MRGTGGRKERERERGREGKRKKGRERGFFFFNSLLACRLNLWRGHGPSPRGLDRGLRERGRGRKGGREGGREGEREAGREGERGGSSRYMLCTSYSCITAILAIFGSVLCCRVRTFLLGKLDNRAQSCIAFSARTFCGFGWLVRNGFDLHSIVRAFPLSHWSLEEAIPMKESQSTKRQGSKTEQA